MTRAAVLRSLGPSELTGLVTTRAPTGTPDTPSITACRSFPPRTRTSRKTGDLADHDVDAFPPVALNESGEQGRRSPASSRW